MPQSSRGLIVQFCKAPIPGKVKTRMLSKLSGSQACELHKQLALTVYKNISDVPSNVDYQLWISSDHEWFDTWTNIKSYKICVQQGDSLGEKLMFTAAEQLEYYDFVVFVGSDCPFISSSHIHSVCSYMRDGKDLVFIPAIDGGYVLIAVKKQSLVVFENISWGTEKVLEESVKIAENFNLSYIMLDEQSDIDRPEDLMRLKNLDFSEVFDVDN